MLRRRQVATECPNKLALVTSSGKAAGRVLCSSGGAASRSSPELSQAEIDSSSWTFEKSPNIARLKSYCFNNTTTHIAATMPREDRKRKIHKTNAKAVEAISFDPEARQEYLSGFHKRKVQRAEHGRELAQRKEKEAVVQARKEVRM